MHKLRPREVTNLLWVTDGICETQVSHPYFCHFAAVNISTCTYASRGSMGDLVLPHGHGLMGKEKTKQLNKGI